MAMQEKETPTSTGTLAGYFEKHSDAERAVDALREAGFDSAQIGVAHRGPHNTTSNQAGNKTEGAWEKVKHFFGLQGAEPYADEKSRGDLANREITATDDTAGSQVNYDENFHENLTTLSVPEDRSRYMAHRFGSSNEGAVVTVNAGDRTAEAQEILTRYGADLGQNASSYDYSQTTSGQAGEVQDTRNIQLLGEILRVHKDRVSRGEVRLRKEVITENQNIQVPVTREELVIERHAVEGNTPAQGGIGQDQEIRIPLTEETASLDKSTVVREEVAVGKRPVGGVRDLSGEVRREELVVDDQTEKKAVNE
ncbi:MAG TPA: YsnF/AvaK domain-containing protein [Acidobacteriaceae bacterium]|nr:YsnF/AvaK domain-containing protein [Acidobacteriaceae bacterium]